MPTKRIRSRREITSNIITYKKRIRALPHTKFTPETQERHKNLLESKIAEWERDVESVDVDNNKLRAIGNAVALFTGYNVKDSHIEELLEQIKLARGLFYKYAYDAGISPKKLIEYTGSKNAAAPYTYRRYVLGSEENLEIFKKFKQHIENNDDNQ